MHVAFSTSTRTVALCPGAGAAGAAWACVRGAPLPHPRRPWQCHSQLAASPAQHWLTSKAGAAPPILLCQLPGTLHVSHALLRLARFDIDRQQGAPKVDGLGVTAAAEGRKEQSGTDSRQTAKGRRRLASAGSRLLHDAQGAHPQAVLTVMLCGLGQIWPGVKGAAAAGPGQKVRRRTRGRCGGGGRRHWWCGVCAAPASWPSAPAAPACVLLRVKAAVRHHSAPAVHRMGCGARASITACSCDPRRVMCGEAFKRA